MNGTESHSLNAQLIKLHLKLHTMHIAYLCESAYQWRQRTQIPAKIGSFNFPPYNETRVIVAPT